MASKAFVTPQQYLATHFEREPELVHGELRERPLPTKSHGRTQQRLAVLLDRLGYCCTEVRMRLAEDSYRIPDVALFEGVGPPDEVPSEPPLLVVEVSSPDDRLHDLLEKFEQYKTWGVPNIWLIEPELKRLFLFQGGLLSVPKLELPQFEFSMTAAELFS